MKINCTMRVLSSFSLLLTLSCASSMSAQKPSLPGQAGAQIARFETQLEELRTTLKIPGLSAAIVKDQKLIWSKGFGHADLENKIAATPETNYRIASLTKTFASTLLMQLVEQGKLNLDDPMSKYSPAFQRRFNNDAIKVRHVLSHTSHDEPGEGYRYDGNRFSYLSDVVMKAAGVGFRELLIKNILDRVEMSASVPGQDALDERANAPWLVADRVNRYEKGLQNLAKPYRLFGTEIIKTAYPPRRISTSAGLISNVVDLAKFDAAIDRHVFVKPETQQRAWTPVVSSGGQTLPYGYGWFIQPYQGQRLIWHYGYWPDSFSSLYLKIPDKKISFILLANSDGLSAPFPMGSGNVSISAFANSFLRLFVFEESLGRTLPDPRWSAPRDPFRAEIEQFTKQTSGYGYEAERTAHNLLNRWLDDRRNSVPKETQLDPKLFDRYAGQFEVEPGRLLTISREGGRFFAQATGEERMEIFAETETRFFYKARDIRLTFIRDDAGQTTALEAIIWSQRFRARKIK